MLIKKKLPFYLVVAIAITMLGLLYIQYSWTKNAIRASELNFERSVQEAISKVIYETEKQEIANKLKDQFKSKRTGLSLINTIDSINQNLYTEFKDMFSDTIITDSIINITKERISIEISQDKYGQPVTRIDTSYIVYNKSEREQQELNESTNESRERELNSAQTDRKVAHTNVDSLMQEIDKFLKRTVIVSDIFQDLFSLSHFIPIEERIDTILINTQIKRELQNKGIDIDYEYGIYSSFKGEMIFEKTGKYTNELKEKGQSFLLFPSDFFSIPNYLFIYFPQRKAFLLNELKLTFIISFLLIILIISIFLYVLISFIRHNKLSEMRNDFINNMTHEFNTPISTISLACETLKDPTFKNNESIVSNYVEIINKESKRLASMSEKILQTAVIDKGHLKIKNETLDVKAIITNVVKNFSPQIEQRNGNIHTFYLAKNHSILADKLHFTNVIYNLLDNASKYTSEKNSEIIIKTFNDKDELVIEIIDNGIGICKKDQSKIFDKLYRVNSGNIHNVKGFGLGLNYVKAIMQLHKAKIKLESEVGKGSTFKLIFKTIN